MPALDWNVQKFARRLLRLERDFKTFQVTPRLGNSVIDSGAIIVKDPITGQPQVVIGDQGDGTQMVNHVSGPTPPQPSVPQIEENLGFVYVRWDGGYDADVWDPDTQTGTLVPTPLDFSRVEVHASPTIDFEPTGDTLRTSIESPRGGRMGVTLPYDQTYYFRLVVRSLSGKASDPSRVASGKARKIETEDITPFAVQADNIADFAIAVTKFRTTTHMIH